MRRSPNKRARLLRKPSLAAQLCLASLALFVLAACLQLAFYLRQQHASPGAAAATVSRGQRTGQRRPEPLLEQDAAAQADHEEAEQHHREQQQQAVSEVQPQRVQSATRAEIGTATELLQPLNVSALQPLNTSGANGTMLGLQQLDLANLQAAATAGDRVATSQTLPVTVQAHSDRTSPLSQAAVICFCYNRPKYLEQTLLSLAKLEGLRHLAVYISQDGNDTGVEQLVQRLGQKELAPPVTRRFTHWQRDRVPQLSPKQPGHAWLTQHYKWGLDRLLLEHGHSHAIIIEDDMLFSPDFLQLFEATAELLEADSSLWCISSWNDNGLKHFDWDAQRLFRTSYFPGLGWMMRRELWAELSPKFPRQAWDHWMRLPSTAQGRECVAPELNRNSNIGETGANMNKSMFRRFLRSMAWATEAVPSFGNLSYLQLPAYTEHVRQLLAQAEQWNGLLPHTKAPDPVISVYLSVYKGEEYPRLARQLQIWPFPRGHHRNVVLLPYKGSTWLLADGRFCPLLPEQLRLQPNPGLQPLPGIQGASCTATCSVAALQCSADDFWFLNSCEALGRHFACEAGCTVEMGHDVPNYVSDQGHGMHGTCLVSQQQPRCASHHNSTSRLCPCVPDTAAAEAHP